MNCPHCNRAICLEKPIKKLNYVTRGKIEESLKNDTMWNLFSERKFAETMFNQRFNFFVLSFSIIISSIVLIYTQENKLITCINPIAVLGFIFVLLFGLSLYKSFLHVRIYVRMVQEHTKEENSIFNLTAQELKTYPSWKRKISVLEIMGKFIPAFCVFSLFFAAILILIFN